jgi:hypothetical protein
MIFFGGGEIYLVLMADGGVEKTYIVAMGGLDMEDFNVYLEEQHTKSEGSATMTGSSGCNLSSTYIFHAYRIIQDLVNFGKFHKYTCKSREVIKVATCSSRRVGN